MTGRNTASRATDPATQDARSRAAWVIVFGITLTVLAIWLTDLNLPLGDSDDGRILARLGLSARNLWDLGPAESGFGARIDLYIRAEYGVEPTMQWVTILAAALSFLTAMQSWIAVAAMGLLVVWLYSGHDDLVLTRTDRRRDYISLSEESILEDDPYRLLTGSGVRRR